MANYLKKELYEQIKEKEQIFDFIQNGSLDGLWYWDLEKQENEWMNPRFWEILGYTPEEMPRKISSWQMIFNQDDLLLVQDNFKKHIEAPNHATVQDVCYSHKNGSLVWMRYRILVIPNEKGKAIRMLGAFRDITNLRKTEEKQKQKNELLTKNEEMYRFLAENTVDIIRYQLPSGEFSYISPNIEEVTGYTAEEYSKFGPLENVVPEDHYILIEIVQKISQGVNTLNIEYRIYHKTGTIIWMESRIKAIRDKKGKPISLLSSSNNITKQKKRQIELKEREQRYKAMYENAPLAFQSLDINGFLKEVNPQWLSILQYQRNEVIGKWFGDFLHPDNVEHFKKNFLRFKEQGFIKDVQFRMIKKNGDLIYVSFEGCIRYSPEGNSKQTYCTFKDITLEKEYQEALIKSEENYKALSENAKYLIFSHRLNGEITYANKFAIAFFDLKPEEVIGKDIKQFISGRDRTENLKRIDQFDLEKMEIQQFELDVKLPNGEQRLLEVTGSPIIQDKHLDSILLTAYDITEKKKSEKKIISQNKSYEALNEELQQTNKELLAAIKRGEESNERFNLAIEASSDGLFDWNLLTNEIYYSPRWKAIIGYKDHELPNRFSVWEERTDPNGVKQVLQILNHLINGEPGKFDVEFKMKHKNGKWVNIQARANIFFNDRGEASRIVGTHTDITKRKEAENKIRSSEEMWRLSIVNSPLGICTNDMEGNFINTNPAYEKMVGHTKDELKELRFFDITHPDYIPENYRLFNEMVTKKNPRYRLEKQYIRKNGELIDVRVHTGTIFNKDGEPMFAMSFVEDITERKKNRKQLDKLLNELTTIYDNDPSYIWVKDTNNNIIKVSNAAARVTGLPKEHIEGKNASELYSEIDNKFYDADTVVINSGQPKLNYLNPLALANGDIRWTITSKIPILENGKDVSGILVFATDVTDLKISEERLRIAIEGSNIGTWECNIKTGEVITNEYWKKKLGYSEEEVEQNIKWWRNKINPKDLTHSNKLMIKHLRAISDIYEAELRVKDKAGNWNWIQNKAKVVEFDKDGKALKVSGILLDINEKKQHEQKIREQNEIFEILNNELIQTNMALYDAKERAEESNRLKSAFLMNMSHEIRTPLNAIVGFTNILKETELDEEQFEYIGHVQQGSNRLLNSLIDILDASQLQQNQLALSTKEYCLITILNEVYYNSRALYQNKLSDIRFDYHCNFNGETRIKTDYERLKKILNQIIDNAFKFTRHGTITLECKKSEKHIDIKIKDTGVGIAPEKLNVIYDFFRQGEESITRGYEGLGLGLPLAKGILELMNFTIKTDSKQGVGTNVCIRIPSSEYTVSATLENETKNKSQILNPQILIVGDDKNSIR